MRGMEKIGRLVAGPLFAVLGMAATTTASAYTVTGTNISAEVTAPAYEGNAVFTFAFTRTSSDSLNNGEFYFDLPSSPELATVSGAIVSPVVVTPANAAYCVALSSTSHRCTISADVSPISFEITVAPTGALLNYTWSIRPGTGTNQPPWLGEQDKIVTAKSGGEKVAGGAGTTLAVAETSLNDGLKGTLTAKGKSTATTIYVGVQELEAITCSGLPAAASARACINFTAVNASGAKVYYPADLSDLVRFAIYIAPVSTSNLQSVNVYYGEPGSFTQLQSCPAKYRTLLNNPPEIPCIESRSALNKRQANALGLPEGTWQFILLNSSNGFVSLD